jgi:tetratricopeptide (TPR) repeat protein
MRVLWLVVLALLSAAPAARAQQDLMYERFISQCNDVGGHEEPRVAINACTQIIRSNMAIGHALAVAYNSRAMRYLDLRDDAHALADFSQAIRYSPHYAQAYINRAILHLARREFPEAAADYTEVIRIIPNNQIGYSARCWARALWGQELAQARADCDHALELSPHRSGALESRGLVDLREGRWQQAFEDYDDAVAGNSGNARALYGRGIAALRLGRAGDSAMDFRAASDLDPNVAHTFSGYGITP